MPTSAVLVSCRLLFLSDSTCASRLGHGGEGDEREERDRRVQLSCDFPGLREPGEEAKMPSMEVRVALPPDGSDFYRYMYAEDPPAELKEGEFYDDLVIEGAVRRDPHSYKTIEVNDGRGIAATLKKEGFCLINHGMGKDFEAADLSNQEAFDKWVLDVALPKLANVIARACDVDAAHALNYCLRAADKETLKVSKVESPVADAHADFTPESGARRILTETVAYKYGSDTQVHPNDDKNVFIIQVWQPLVPEVYKRPLALCTLDSVTPDTYIRRKMIYKHRIGETFCIAHRDDQRWLYFPRMTSDEALVFITWAQDGRTVPHSGAIDSNDIDGVPRRSLESRWAVRLTST